MICHWLYMSGIGHAAGRRLPVEGEYRCDFYLPSLQLYIEYWGDENAPGQLSAKLAKRGVYERSGLSLLELDDPLSLPPHAASAPIAVRPTPAMPAFLTNWRRFMRRMSSDSELLIRSPCGLCDRLRSHFLLYREL